jgi:hypothetical protein
MSFYGIALLATALSTSAQYTYNPLTYPQSNGGPQYTTIDVYENCTDSAIGTDTVTSTVVQTTCPLCSHSGIVSTMNPTHTTVYTTVYQTLCSTGLAPVTYTITETCTGPTPSWSQGPNYIPPGYTQTVTICTVCNGPPTQVTLTVPCHVCGDNTPPATHPTPPPSTGQLGGVTKASYTTTTMCPGTTMCHHTTSIVAPTITRSTPPPYVAGATPHAHVWGGLVGGAVAAVGAVGAALL